MSPLIHLPAPRPKPAAPARRAFTLVELLVAMTVLLILILMMVGITTQTNKVWRTSYARTTAFQGARNAFERITANLSQATLNTYLDYYNAAGYSRSDILRASAKSQANTASALASFVPLTYDRAAELHFICGQSSDLIPKSGVTRPTHAIFFLCPLGHVADPTGAATANASSNDFGSLNRVLNAVGYYIEFSNEATSALVPAFITPAPANYRYRLMELNQPSQNLGIYSSKVAYSGTASWFELAVDPTTGSTPAPVLVTADNIVALIIRPKAANQVATGPMVTEVAPHYSYDTKGYFPGSPSVESQAILNLSKNQLPPLVQITLIAIDSDSALRLANQNGANAPPIVDTSRFTDVMQYDTDLAAVESVLQAGRYNYQVFVTDVNVPGAKWSQTN